MTAVFGSLDVGSVVGLLASGPLIHRFGWPSVFYLFAVLGLIWAAIWPFFKPGQPDPQFAAAVPAPAELMESDQKQQRKLRRSL